MKQETITLIQNADTAELVGIMLGDGCLNKCIGVDRIRYTISITLNGETESKIIDHVKLILKRVFNRECIFQRLKNTKAIILVYHNKDVFDALVSIGLTPGNKVKNQVSVPGWIKTSDIFISRCLRGLLDTDGCITKNCNRKDISISFRNHSINLLNDFAELCNSLSINAKVEPASYNVIISPKDAARKFIDIVKPFKWEIFKDRTGIDEMILNYIHPKPKRHNIYEMNEIAKNNGGECLSDECVNVRTKLLWKCGYNHQWKASPVAILQGRWCPACGKKKCVETQKRNAKPHPMKFVVDRDELDNLVREKSLCEIGRQFGVSDNAIRKRCKKFGIDNPVQLRRGSN